MKNSFKNKSILVTGSTGLIGKNLVPYLIDNGASDLFLPNREDIKDIDNLIVSTNKRFDIVFHLAGYAQPDKFMSEKIDTIVMNTEITRKLFNFLKLGGVFFYASSTEVYSGLTNNITENMIGTSTPEHPRACYIESKKCGETICHSYKDRYQIKIGRIGLTYGPGAKPDDKRVINSIIRQAKTNRHIKLLDNGESIRTICYVSDLVEMITEILNGEDITYNLAGDHKLSILDIANIVARETNSSIKINDKVDAGLGGSSVMDINIDRYKSEFNKHSFISPQQGLSLTINYND
jgi:UDP-glucuronate decarboxylase